MAFVYSIGPIFTVVEANPLTLDRNNGRNQKLTLTGNVDIDTISNLVAEGDFLDLKVVQDGIGGHTLSISASVLWPDSSAPTFTTTAAAFDTILFYVKDGQIHAQAELNWG